MATQRAGGLTQWGVLTRRTLETFVRNRLTLAILVGSPALVVGMFAILFRPGAFDFRHPTPSSMVMIGFWVVFAAFFFGLTYGLLQICTERHDPASRAPRRLAARRLRGVKGDHPGAFPRLGGHGHARCASSAGPLTQSPAVHVRLDGRQPSASARSRPLGLGLLTSASVRTVAQATLALPMLCFPAVLFSGAILPVDLMADPRAGLSVVIPSRWAFEAIGHDLGARGHPRSRRFATRAPAAH